MGLRVQQCCCGCSLKTGSLLIASVHIVISGVVLTVVPYLLFRVYYPVEKYIYSRNNASDEGSSVEKHEDEEKRRKYETLVEGVTGVYIVLIVTFSFNLFINILLTIGVNKEKPLLVIIWIIANSVYLGACCIAFIMSVFILFSEWQIALLLMKSTGFCAVVTTYFTVVVNSFYHQLDRRQVAPRDDRIPQIVFTVEPPPPLPPDPPPPPYQKHL